ncbi:MAG: four helix bundle protein [Acidobacteriia bacterium]|nr:four helix bundle protein [Terriglobia bacterium]
MRRSYKDLIVWRKAMDLVTEVYKATSVFPKNELYGLTTQLRRAAVSVPCNIAEGQGRLTRGEFQQFLGYARGSIMEVETLTQISADLKLLPSTQSIQLQERTAELGRILNGLLSAVRGSDQRSDH